MSQLSLTIFPKPDTSKITIDKVFEYMEFEDKLDFIKRIRSVSNKSIRLAKEMAKQKAPMMLDFHDTVRSLLQSNISNERIDKVKPFKEILFRTVITDVRYQNGRYTITTKRVKRK